MALVHGRLPPLGPEDARFYSGRAVAFARVAELLSTASTVDILVTDPGFADRAERLDAVTDIIAARAGDLRTRVALHPIDVEAVAGTALPASAEVRAVQDFGVSHRFLVVDDRVAFVFLVTDLSSVDPADAHEFAVETSHPAVLDEKRREFALAWVGGLRSRA